MAKEYKEYIERNLLWKALDVAHLFDNGNPRHIAQQVVEEQPTADVVEVVHGEWITKCAEGSWTHYRYSCSNCGSGFDSNSNYCPNCGAKMDGKKVE